MQRAHCVPYLQSSPTSDLRLHTSLAHPPATRHCTPNSPGSLTQDAERPLVPRTARPVLLGSCIFAYVCATVGVRLTACCQSLKRPVCQSNAIFPVAATKAHTNINIKIHHFPQWLPLQLRRPKCLPLSITLPTRATTCAVHLTPLPPPPTSTNITVQYLGTTR